MGTKAINNTESAIALQNGRVIPASGELDIDPVNFRAFSKDAVLWPLVVSGDVVINDGQKDLNLSDAMDHLKGYLQKSPVTDDGRLISAPNRVPGGYSLYLAGAADNVGTPGYGTGTKLKLSSSVPSVEFRLLNHYYAMGAKGTWVGCSENNYLNATLVASASSGLTNATGDYNKANIGGPYNMIVPVAEGTGAWAMNLADVFAGTSVLKATPVPSTGNNGWFDYNSATNVLTRNMDQAGGYNIYDFDVNLHAFSRYIWGSPQNGQVSDLDVSGLVGKLLFNTWKIKLDLALDGGSLGSEQVRVIFDVATKGNI